jgi:hypothetical protein
MTDGVRQVDRDAAVARYKGLLKASIDRRPSGTRQRIATALGKHKSFVSQITNPAYPSPVPARHLGTIFALCHFSAEERATFLEAYRAAHPRSRPAAEPSPAMPRRRRDPARDEAPPHSRILEIEVPLLADPALQRDLEAAIRETAGSIIALALRSQELVNPAGNPEEATR